MARRKRRKSAGPPPAGRPRSERAGAEPERRAKPSSRSPGEPVPTSFKGVLIRAAIVAVIFYPYLVYVIGEDPGAALVVSLVAFALMIPLGMLIDRMRYRLQMRRFERRRASSERPPER